MISIKDRNLLSAGLYTDVYFLKAISILKKADKDPTVTMQFFAKKEGILCGIKESLEILETVPGLQVGHLSDGDAVLPWESVMHVTGKYTAFAHLETPVLGCLARGTLIASNARKVVNAARGKPVIFMGARHDHWAAQTADNYAAQIGGVSGVSTFAGIGDGLPVGTMPHALIACFGGDTVEATLALTRWTHSSIYPNTPIISLVDYHNDCVKTSLEVARAMRATFGDEVLYGVRLDTSEALVDESVKAGYRYESSMYTNYRGVCPNLVRKVREALDNEGFPYVRIIVSGGFTPLKINIFESEYVPVDGYGVGSSILGHNRGFEDELFTGFDFTADIVKVDGKMQSKTGREFKENPQMKTRITGKA